MNLVSCFIVQYLKNYRGYMETLEDVVNELNKTFLKIQKYQDKKIVDFCYAVDMDSQEMVYDEKAGSLSYENKAVEEGYSTLLDNKNDLYTLLEVMDKLNKKIALNTKESQKINKEHLEYIQKKRNITVKEFAEIFSMSKSKQQNRRGRLHDPLPYHQEVENGKILYYVDEVEKWFKNQYK